MIEFEPGLEGFDIEHRTDFLALEFGVRIFIEAHAEAGAGETGQRAVESTLEIPATLFHVYGDFFLAVFVTMVIIMVVLFLAVPMAAGNAILGVESPKRQPDKAAFADPTPADGPGSGFHEAVGHDAFGRFSGMVVVLVIVVMVVFMLMVFPEFSKTRNVIVAGVAPASVDMPGEITAAVAKT